MNNKVLYGSLAVAVVLLGAASIAWAATSNYPGWRAFMGNRMSGINEQNFDRFTQMQRNVLDGNYDEAAKIRTELGLGQGGRNGGGCPMMQGRGGRRGGQGQAGAAGTCPMAQNGGAGFVDKNNNGICDNHENLK